MEASSLSELTPMLFNMGSTHLGSEASNYSFIFYSIANDSNESYKIAKKFGQT